MGGFSSMETAIGNEQQP
jgi:hypothetical protein